MLICHHKVFSHNDLVNESNDRLKSHKNATLFKSDNKKIILISLVENNDFDLIGENKIFSKLSFVAIFMDTFNSNKDWTRVLTLTIDFFSSLKINAYK